ncbi:VWA domain-containing protein [Candidatus Poribacteria bacterium]|nr:VWA domain-containing protein [Candidatus Poribacteria bacterium]
MRFEQPLAFWLLASVPLVVLLSMMKARRASVRVPSLVLWQGTPRDTRARTLSRRARPSLHLLLQLAALLAAILALAGPRIPSSHRRATHVVYVIDTSARMQATDLPPSRFDAARSALLRDLSRLPRGARVALVAPGSTPSFLVPFTSRHSVVRQALDALRPTDARLDLSRAVSFAEAATQGMDAGVRVYAGASRGDGSPSGPDVALRNVAVRIASVERDGSESSAIRATVEMVNASESSYAGSVYLRVDGRLADATMVDVRPGTTQDVVLAANGSRTRDVALSATIEPGDQFAPDNASYAVLPAERPLRVVIAGARSPLLEALLALNDPIEIRSMSQDAYIPTDDTDLTVFRGFLPDPLPTGDVVAIEPDRDLPYARRSADRAFGNLTWDRADGLLRFVDLGEASVRIGHGLDLSEPSRPLIRVDGSTLVARHDDANRHTIVFGFDPFDLGATDFALRPGAVVFFANLVDSVRSRQRAIPVKVLAGETVPLNIRGQSAVHVITSEGQTVDATSGFADTTRAGIYQVTIPGRETELFAVNVDAASLDSPPASHSTTRNEPNREPDGEAPVWQWFAWAALAFLTLDWLAFARR